MSNEEMTVAELAEENEDEWCNLCKRYVVPKKEFKSIGWVGFVAGFAYLVAAFFNDRMSESVYTNSLAASLATGIGNILLNVVLLLVLPLVLVSIIYILFYRIEPMRCPICNSQELTEKPPE